MLIEHVATSPALARAIAAIEIADWIALDTEFMRERTYFAKLCLVQIATADAIWIIDPLAVEVAPLLDVLYRPRPLKVLHAARQDIELFFDLRGNAPPAIFDTQVAAAFLGFDDQIGYGNLVKAITDHVLPKTQTRTNWTARPLSADQVAYAADDVRYLRVVYEKLRADLIAAGRMPWAEEECARLSDSTLYAQPLERVHLRIKSGQLLPPAAQHRLRDLAVWREQTARTRDLPRSWIITDQDLLTIAQHPPNSPTELVRDVPASKPWQGDIINVLQHAAGDETTRLWPAVTRWDPAQNKQLSHLSAVVRNTAAEHRISASLLATRKDLERLLSGNTDIAAMQSWRRSLIGERLLAVLSAG